MRTVRVVVTSQVKPITSKRAAVADRAPSHAGGGATVSASGSGSGPGGGSTARSARGGSSAVHCWLRRQVEVGACEKKRRFVTHVMPLTRNGSRVPFVAYALADLERSSVQKGSGQQHGSVNDDPSSTATGEQTQRQLSSGRNIRVADLEKALRMRFNAAVLDW